MSLPSLPAQQGYQRHHHHNHHHHHHQHHHNQQQQANEQSRLVAAPDLTLATTEVATFSDGAMIAAATPAAAAPTMAPAQDVIGSSSSQQQQPQASSQQPAPPPPQLQQPQQQQPSPQQATQQPSAATGQQQQQQQAASPSFANPDTRTHVVGELYDTERSYVESLQILVEKYMIPLKSLDSNRILIDSNLVDEIFYTIPEILKHHETFLSALQDRLSSDWDTSQVIGNVFIEAFTNQQIIDTYTAFINNWKNARQAIKVATQAKPAFEKFLEAMSREHRNKLTLDALLIMPVQRIPRYELLIKELIKHTPEDHPDYGPLIEAQKEIHELALKIDRAEREMIHQEQLKDLESLIEGHVELQHPQRDFIRYDLVTILGASSLTVAKKERVLFLFCDLLIMTSVKKKASRRSNLQTAFANSSNDLSLLEGNKFKLLLRVSLDQVEVRLSSDQIQIQQQHQEQQHQLQLQQQNKLIQDRKKETESDLHLLHQIEALTSKMIIDDNKAKINDTINELTCQLRQKLYALEQNELKNFTTSGHQSVAAHPHHHHQSPTSAAAAAAQQATADMYGQSSATSVSVSAPANIQSSPTTQQSLAQASNFINSPAYNVNAAPVASAAAAAAAASFITPTTSPSGNQSVGQQQESNTSLEFLISNATGGMTSGKDSLNATSCNSATTGDSLSGEQGYVVSGGDNQPVSQQLANCETLVVTFASVDRRQAFLLAFIEAKQQRYQLQQQRIQFPRMYSSSVTLKLSQASDRRSMSHDSRKTGRHQGEGGGDLVTSSSNLSPMRANKLKNQQQQHKPPISAPSTLAPTSTTTTRISSAPLGPSQHPSSSYGTTTSIVHQMSAPQSLTLEAVSGSLTDSVDISLSQCTLCSANISTEIEPHHHHHQRQQQRQHRPHHHHHQLMHQSNSRPASLDTICCHEQHAAIVRDSTNPTLANRGLAQLIEPAAGLINRKEDDYRYQQHQHHHHHHHHQQQQQYHKLTAGTKNTIGAGGKDGGEKANLMLHMNQLLFDKLAPKFLLTIPMNFLNTQHPALKFTCSALRHDIRQPPPLPTNQRRSQTFRDNTGQLWISMSNGYVSHVALISIRKRPLRKSYEPHNPAAGAPDCGDTCEAKQCFTIVPVIQAAGDICNSQINCAAQVRWKGVKRVGQPKVDQDEVISREHISEQKTTSDNAVTPPVDIRPTSTSSTTVSSSKFLSESAPSNTFSDGELKGQIATTSASTTRLEVPCITTGRAGSLNRQPQSQEEVDSHSPRPSLHNYRLLQNRLNASLPPVPTQHHQRLNVTDAAGGFNTNQQHHHHHHHNHHHRNSHLHHHHHHSHHHHHHHHHPHISHHSHHQAHNIYNGRHNTVPLGEFRKALERQHRISDLKPNVNQRQFSQLAPPANTPEELKKTMLSANQRVNSLDLADRSSVTSLSGEATKKGHNRALTPPADSSAHKSFRSARLLRHQASLKTSSILAKLVGSASKRSSYLRRSRPEVSEKQNQSDADENDADLDAQTNTKKPLTDSSSIDSSILALTTPGANKCLLSAATSRDENNAVVSPLSSASSLVSTTSSITVNSACASSPNRSTCDLSANNSNNNNGGNSMTCCKGGPTCSQSQGSHNKEYGFRSRSATVPTRSLYQQYLDMERNRCSRGGCDQRRLEEAAKLQQQSYIKDDSYKVSEIVGETSDEATRKQNVGNDDEDEHELDAESSLWLGCDDGSLIIIHCLINNNSDCNCCDIGQGNLGCNNRHSEVKMNAAICDLCTYKEEKVFVALANGQLAVFRRNDDGNGDWSLTNPQILTLTACELNSTSKLCLIGDDYIWYSYGKNIFILNIATLKLENTIMVPTNDPSLQFTMQSITIENMEPMSNQIGVWISFKNSHLIQLYDVEKCKLLLELNLFKPIDNMLSYGNEIIRQHKTACLKATALLSVNNTRDKCSTLFIGTSAGIILYLSISYDQLAQTKEPITSSLNDLNPQVAGLQHGHSGHVKFLHLIEAEEFTSDHHLGGGRTVQMVDSSSDNKNNDKYQPTSININRDVFLISGGQGIDLYGPNEEQQVTSQQFGNNDEDNLNHLMLWQL